MNVGICYRCRGNAFLERLTPGEAAWVCLQCGAYRYVRTGDEWPFAAASLRPGAQDGKE